MRSLFLKIFLWFWGAMALVAIVFATLVAQTQEQAHNQLQARTQAREREQEQERGRERERFERRFSEPVRDALTVSLETAAALLESTGPDVLKTHLARLESTGHIRAFVFDAQGRELPHLAVAPVAAAKLNAEISKVEPQALKQVVQRAVQRGAVEPTPSGGLLLAARRARHSGQFYIIAGAMRSQPFGPTSGRPTGPPGGRGDRRRHRGSDGHGPDGHGSDGHGPDGRGPDGPSFRGLAPWLFATPPTQALRLLAVLATTGLVCYGLVRHLTAPILQLRAAVHRLADGDLSARVGAQLKGRRDELGVLGRDFDLMAERLESLMHAQHRLIADISHELRSPLARVNVALGLVRGTAGPEATEDLDRIELETERLNAMIGQLLTLSRLESGEQAAANTPVDLARLVEEIAADADFEARSRQRAVRVVSSTHCQISGTEPLLRSAIENVVRNAVRYTNEGTAVEISLAPAGNSQDEPGEGNPQAVIRVRDHGAGVPEESLAHLFRPFYRIADARDRQSGGTGLGLAITQRAVRLHGGTVTASNAPGGLLVEICLPLSEYAEWGGEVTRH